MTVLFASGKNRDRSVRITFGSGSITNTSSFRAGGAGGDTGSFTTGFVAVALFGRVADFDLL